MEGNNEVDIDGTERALDYLGSEDSFGFSWGFQRTFAGLRSGITLMDPSPTHRLSVYRFHDHMPIRFAEHLLWRINWRYERHFNESPQWRRKHDEALERGGCRVDYATVHYWYHESPGCHTHDPLQPLEARRATVTDPDDGSAA